GNLARRNTHTIQRGRVAKRDGRSEPTVFRPVQSDAVADRGLGRCTELDAEPKRRRVAQWPNLSDDRSTRDALALRSARLRPAELRHARERWFRSQSHRVEMRARQRCRSY